MIEKTHPVTICQHLYYDKTQLAKCINSDYQISLLRNMGIDLKELGLHDSVLT